ncbi:glycosyltransferase family 2 protein [Nitrosopumilus sp. S6]
MKETIEEKVDSRSNGILVCIPSYNAASTIKDAIETCKKFATEIIVINDGSSDDTEKIAKKTGVDVITHKRNRGYGGAIKTGLEEGLKRNAKVTITFDADLQHDAKDIPKIIQPILSNEADIVIGSRFLNDTDDVKPYRKFGIKLITKLVNSFSKSDIKDAESGLRAYGLDSLKLIVPSLETEGMGMSAEILLKASIQKLKIVEIPRKEMYPEGIQTSSKNPLKHGFGVIVTIFKLIIEHRPLQAFGIPAIVFFIASGISALYVVDFYNYMDRLPVGMTVFTLLLVSIGFFFSLAAVILYVLSRVSSRISFGYKN